MNQNLISIKSGIQELGIFEKGNDAWVTSRDLARAFEKEHKNVLRDIEESLLKVPEDFARLNFELSKYKDKSGKSNPEYRRG